MPHITIEYSSSAAANIDLHRLAQALHEELSRQETVNLEAIKTRTLCAENVFLGSGRDDRFIHITLKLLPGRAVALKEKMAKALLDRTLSIIGNPGDCRVSMEVADLGVYLKNS